MSFAPDSSAPNNPLKAENQALRTEIRQLREQALASTQSQAHSDLYEQSQARFRTVFENSPQGKKIIGPDLNILQANQALANQLGLPSPEVLVGRRILEFAHPHHLNDWNVLQEKLWDQHLPSFSLETSLVRPDGSSFWCQVTSVLFPDGNQLLGYTTLEDISERKKAEATLKRLYDAQETIMHIIAHDLKSLLSNIEMLVSTLQQEEHLLRACPAGAQEEVGQFLELMQRSCTQATELLAEVLYIGQLDARQLEKQPTDMKAFLEHCLEVYQVVAKAQGIDLQLEVPAEKVLVRLNPERFARAIDNLLSNALKFTPRGGHIRVGLQQQQGRVRLSVADTGMGIPLNLQKHVFDKFSSAARAGFYGTTSTGLGLYITKQIVQLHGGTIWLESREQAGTTFFIELP
jgi:two-component system sensor histidine kinase VicK